MMRYILVLFIIAGYCEIAYLYFANERKEKTKMIVMIPVRGKLESRRHFEKRCMSLVRNGVISMQDAQQALIEDVIGSFVPGQKTVPPMPKAKKPTESCTKYVCKVKNEKEFDSTIELLAEVARLETELANAKETAKKCSEAFEILQSFNSCNDCAVVRYCKYAPKWGDHVRYNCPHYIDEL